MDNWTTPKYNVIQHTIASVVAKNLHVAFCLKGRPKKEIRPDSTSLLLMQVNLGDKSGGV